ncbi:uncharacterized protein LOC131072293 [Cryptomeria japonica]|uniref:uncharacterized protein LOC131072293 n=1 Tax=Cryptomeria japonica TaxID=3369 RepID=UPI0027DA0563|nr:uncharacterized protein LOC131072293 [Cryptomeria japonica]
MEPCPNIEVVRAYVKHKWALKGNVKISALPKGLLTFAFSCEEDKIRILYGSPWLVGKTALVLHKWHPNLNMSDSLLVQVPVWVKLPGLPLEYWAESIFSGIASSFGELLSIDPVTTSRRGLTHARFCVGIAHDVDMPEQIDIVSKLGTWKQQIEYESIRFACFHYKKVGHWAKNCPLKPKGENKQAKSIVESKKALEKKEDLRKEQMKVDNPLGGQIRIEEIKDQNESSKENIEMVIADTLASMEAPNEEDQKDKDIKEVEQSEEGKITGSQEEKADSSLSQSGLICKRPKNVLYWIRHQRLREGGDGGGGDGGRRVVEGGRRVVATIVSAGGEEEEEEGEDEGEDVDIDGDTKLGSGEDDDDLSSRSSSSRDDDDDSSQDIDMLD